MMLAGLGLAALVAAGRWLPRFIRSEVRFVRDALEARHILHRDEQRW